MPGDGQTLLPDPSDPSRWADGTAARDLSPAETVRSWLAAASRLPASSFTAWATVLAGVPTAFRCTDPAIAAEHRVRIAGCGPIGGGPPVLRFDLIETDRVGWPAAGASPIWRMPPDRLDRCFIEAGLAALMPERRAAEAPYPWIFFDPATGHGLMLVRTVADLPAWTAGAPFSLLVHLAWAWRGARLLHAATLGVGRDGILLVGAGGAGKSATTLSGLMAGLLTVGDDYVLVEPGPVPTAWPVYRLFKQSPLGLARFPALPDDLTSGPLTWHGKAEFDPERVVPGCMAASLGLRAIVLPRIGGAGRTAFGPVSPRAAFSALASAMLPQLPGARLAGFSWLTRLTRTLPAFEARLSPDPTEVGLAFRAFLDRARS